MQHKPVLYASIATKHTKEIGPKHSSLLNPSLSPSQHRIPPSQHQNRLNRHLNQQSILTPLRLLLHILKPPPSQDEMTSLSNR